VPLVARNGSALLVAALLIFGVVRPLMKRRAVEPAVDAAAAPKPGAAKAAKAELGQAIATELGEQRSASADITLDMIEAAPGYQARASLIRDFVKQDPARAALVVRDLIRADSAKEEADA
jgi:flagellar M-ring protein FliF